MEPRLEFLVKHINIKIDHNAKFFDSTAGCLLVLFFLGNKDVKHKTSLVWEII